MNKDRKWVGMAAAIHQQLLKSIDCSEQSLSRDFILLYKRKFSNSGVCGLWLGSKNLAAALLPSPATNL
jgi:hypothetical protein